MSVRSRRKKMLTRYLIIGAVVVAVFGTAIFFLVRAVNKIFGEKPVPGTEANPTEMVAIPTATPIPWDPAGVPVINHIIASSEILTVGYEPVAGATGYEINYRSEEGDWEQVVTQDTTCFIPINSGFTYHVKVRSVGPEDSFGPFSGEGVVSAEAVRPVVRIEGQNSHSVKLAWPLTREGADYLVYYRTVGEEDWHQIESKDAFISIGGLRTDTQYEVMVDARKEDFATLQSEVLQFTPEVTPDYGDPFLNVYAFLKVGGESKSVPYTAEKGCLGVNCWAQLDTSLYTDVALGTIDCALPGGTPMVITADEEGHYVCERMNNRYSIHVTGTVNGEEKQGWVLANAMFVDLAMIYPASNQYSIQYDRTNAYSSLFSCGGDGKEVDVKSDHDTRFNPLYVKNGEESLKVKGYNEIADITGKALPNYGPKEQMPAVWDVAITLLTAQKNALDKGYCLLIYEAYRPNATSKKVYNAMTGNGYFREEAVNKNLKDDKGNDKKMTLANGYLVGKNYTEAYFIANNSSHNRGIALDLTIMKYDSVDVLGEEVEMQTKMHTLDYRCDMTYNTKEAGDLYNIMTTGTGLAPLVAKQEWWHFELGRENISLFPLIKDYIYANYKI